MSVCLKRLVIFLTFGTVISEGGPFIVVVDCVHLGFTLYLCS